LPIGGGATIALPDRFTPARAVARPALAYFPFGGGPRHCIGSAFATTEMQLIVAAVAQRYRLTRVPGVRVTPVAGLTLRPSPAGRASSPDRWRPAAGARSCCG